MKENKKELKTKERGITLIALVITIIVLLILAGVSIAMLTGENGILAQAQRAKNETENAQKDEEGVLENYEQYIEGSTNGGTLTTVSGTEATNTTVYDSLGNKIVVPAGFRVVNPGDNVEDGIVIEDVSHGVTAGSQFVWIPVGIVKKEDASTINIKLSRYTFDINGNETDEGDNEIAEWGGIYEELQNSNLGNEVSKSIEDFKSSANNNNGYYIGRYEARTATLRNSKDDQLTQITLKSNDYVYNYVTQQQAAEESRNMYNSNNFESDLMNSYAWDTAISFLQKCDNREDMTIPYSRLNSLNTGGMAPKGTASLETKDLICNVYDMASNCIEWTTETITNLKDIPCSVRGGSAGASNYYTTIRSGDLTTGSGPGSTFRPILYLSI